MPTYKVGDMWSAFDDADLFCITTNSTLNKKGELVMGKGIAGKASERFTWLPKFFGDLLIKKGKERYGMLFYENWNVKHKSISDSSPILKIAAFQTKYDWKKPSPIDLVAFSIGYLQELAIHNPNKLIHLPFPGIGNGGLNPFAVKPLLDNLPENVTIWRDK